jgi:hypothetical protein
MIDAYLDESGIHDGAEVCLIAGYFGGRVQWRKFSKAAGILLCSPFRVLGDESSKRIGGSGGPSYQFIAYPAAFHASAPPFSTLTLVKPCT